MYIIDPRIGRSIRTRYAWLRHLARARRMWVAQGNDKQEWMSRDLALRKDAEAYRKLARPTE